jgi:hypothetical protein
MCPHGRPSPDLCPHCLGINHVKIDIHCKLDDSSWHSATSAHALCSVDGTLRPCASREMFAHLMASHRADHLCAECLKIFEAQSEKS